MTGNTWPPLHFFYLFLLLNFIGNLCSWSATGSMCPPPFFKWTGTWQISLFPITIDSPQYLERETVPYIQQETSPISRQHYKTSPHPDSSINRQPSGPYIHPAAALTVVNNYQNQCTVFLRQWAVRSFRTGHHTAALPHTHRNIPSTTGRGRVQLILLRTPLKGCIHTWTLRILPRQIAAFCRGNIHRRGDQHCRLCRTPKAAGKKGPGLDLSFRRFGIRRGDVNHLHSRQCKITPPAYCFLQ